MGILSWIIVGLIGGWLADQFVHGPKYGIIGVTSLGIVGGLAGGFLASTFMKIPDAVSGINLTSIITAFLGSLALLLVMRFSSRIRV
jgi:uncharacterized membrane protein YeaQ/YmgE (transglycosylase-associated protein family)